MENEVYAEDFTAINGTMDLEAAITRLEMKKAVLEEDLKDHFNGILENLKPANILKNTLHEVQESVPLKNNLLKIVLGLGAGYFSRKLVVGKSAGLLKKALGTVLQFGVTKLVAGKEEGETDHNAPLHPKKRNFLKRILSV
jgi:hypothetical protein